MTPQTVNAYYSPPRNEIVFPAAILQPPFFDPAADPAINYGGIGGVIGHEMTHGFDDQGRKFDGTGRLADWWTAEDDAKFRRPDRRGWARSIRPSSRSPGAHIKGDLTMGENIADLGGVAAGARRLPRLAARQAGAGDRRADRRPAGVPGLGAGLAQRIRPDDLRQRHGLRRPLARQARVNGVVRNIDAWYAAWDIKPGDTLYLAPDQRVHIW